MTGYEREKERGSVLDKWVHLRLGCLWVGMCPRDEDKKCLRVSWYEERDIIEF